MDIVSVVSDYLRIILEFLIELYVFCALVTLRLNRAPRFALRVSAVAIVLAAGFGAAFLYNLFGDNVFGRVLIYILLFALVTLHVRLCFNEDYNTVLFCCSFAYAVQNLFYKLFLILWGVGENFRLYDGWGNLYELYYRLIYYFFFAVIAVATYFLFIRSLTLRMTDNSRINYRMLITSLIVLAITIVLCSLEDVFFARLSTERIGRFTDRNYYVLWQTGNAFSVVCCAVVMLLISRTVEQKKLEKEVEYLQYAIKQSKQQYEISKDTIDMINIKCHDIKYKLSAFISSRESMSSQAVEDLYKSISIYDSKVSTGNELLDVLFTEKSLYCEQNGIEFTCMIEGQKLSFMESGDLCCLFGNIIDNALEAVINLKEKQKRIINIVIKSKNDMLIVQEENYFSAPVSFSDGLPLTTKADKNYHGFGLRSIRMIARKYGGELTTFVRGDVFHLNILFSGAYTYNVEP